MKRIAMTWDYPEVNVFAGSSGSWRSALDYVIAVVEREADAGRPATVLRGSAAKTRPRPDLAKTRASTR